MNRAYSIVWNAARQMWMVAAEKTSSRGGGIKTVLQAAALPLMLLMFSGGATAAYPNVPLTLDGEPIIVGPGGLDEVYGGETRTGTILNGRCPKNGDFPGDAFALQKVRWGGVANETVVNAFGFVVVNENGIANNTAINKKGMMDVQSGGKVATVTVASRGGLIVEGGGTATGISLEAGAALATTTKAKEVRGVRADGNVAFSIQNNVANNILLENGSLLVEENGQSNNTLVKKGGSEIVIKNGVAHNTIVEKRGDQYIFEGGKAQNTLLKSGGRLLVNELGTAIDVTQEAGGALQLSTNVTKVTGTRADNVAFSVEHGVANNILLEKNGILRVMTLDSSHDTIINKRGTEIIEMDGQSFNSTINEKGKQEVKLRGISEGSVIKSGGILEVNTGGTARSITQETGGVLVLNTGAQHVEGIHSGNVNFLVKDGLASHVLLEKGGQLDVLPGQSSLGTIINSEAIEYVQSGGATSGTTINNGGIQLVDIRGVTDGTVINAGGQQYIARNAVANNTVVNEAGIQLIDSEGIARNTVVNSGGFQYLVSGGTAKNTTVNSNGLLLMDSGAIITGRTEIGSGGMLMGLRNDETVIVNNGELVWTAPQDVAFSMTLNGTGSMGVSGGSLALHNALINQQNIAIAENGILTVDKGSQVNANVTTTSGGQLNMAGGSILSGVVNGTGGLTLAENASWLASGDSSVSSLTLDKGSSVALGADRAVRLDRAPNTPVKLTVGNLQGNGGTFFLHTDTHEHLSDHLVVDGGRATGQSMLDIMVGDNQVGRATSGDGIALVKMVNGATSEQEAFLLSHSVEGGAYNYNLRRNAEGAWHLTTDKVNPDDPPLPPTPPGPVPPGPVPPGPTPDYRHGLSAYLSAPVVASQLADMLAEQAYRGRKEVTAQGVWLNVGGGHLKVRDTGKLHKSDSSDLSGLQGGIVLGADVWGYGNDDYAVWTGIYAGTGHSDMDAWLNGDRAGTVKDNAWAGGAYLGFAHDDGAHAQLAVQGTHHHINSNTNTSKNASADGNGWSVSAEAGYAFEVTDQLNLDPYVGWQYHYTAINDARDEVSRLKWGNENRQGVTAGLRLGNEPGRNPGGVLPTVSQLPVAWWTGASVTRNYGKGATLDVSAARGDGGDVVTFRGQDTGTSGRLEAGLMAEIRPDVTLGAGVNWQTWMAGNGEDGYGGEVKVRVGF